MSPADQRRLRAEALVRRPGLIGATGDKRDAVLELRAEAEAALTDADARLRAAADDRLTAAARIRACNRALVGTGQVIDRRTGAPAQYLLRRSDAFDDPFPDPAELEVLGVGGTSRSRVRSAVPLAQAGVGRRTGPTAGRARASRRRDARVSRSPTPSEPTSGMDESYERPAVGTRPPDSVRVLRLSPSCHSGADSVPIRCLRDNV